MWSVYFVIFRENWFFRTFPKFLSRDMKACGKIVRVIEKE